jgi:L-lysine 2,3-aminomutase
MYFNSLYWRLISLSDSSDRNALWALTVFETAPSSVLSPWQKELQQGFHTVSALLAYLGMDCASAPYLINSKPGFPFSVTRFFAGRIKKGDWYDPLLLQVIPQSDEEKQIGGYTDNPVGDREAMIVPGLLHKYQGRALLIASRACAANCRFCLRKALADISPDTCFDGGVWDYLSKNKGINELILSGGDPLMLRNDQLARIIDRFAVISHMKTLRIHTRMPVFIPSRVDQGLLELLENIQRFKRIVLVLHVNHLNEISDEVINCIARIRQAGMIILQQGVLLKGINDSCEVLKRLYNSLIGAGVLPYYLHQLDRVNGAAHFEVDEAVGRNLMSELRKNLPGYAVPRYVREVTGAGSKIPLEFC